jgi:hypothetical protein
MGRWEDGKIGRKRNLRHARHLRHSRILGIQGIQGTVLSRWGEERSRGNG